MTAKQLEPPEKQDLPAQAPQTFVSHLVELRSRILRALACVTLVLLALMPIANDLYAWLAAPLMSLMPGGATMIATEVASPFFAPFKLAVFVAVFISVPYIFYQAWAFVAPGLYLHERRLALPLLVSSTLLFYFGVAFAYYVVFPLVFGFFTTVAPTGVTVMTDINHYLSFVLTMFLAFGAAFEVPVATYLVVRTGITDVDALRAKRPYIIVGAFIVAAVLTPPDVMSQTLLALPVWCLFELGLVMCRITGAGQEDEAEDAAPAAEGGSDPSQGTPGA